MRDTRKAKGDAFFLLNTKNTEKQRISRKKRMLKNGGGGRWVSPPPEELFSYTVKCIHGIISITRQNKRINTNKTGVG